MDRICKLMISHLIDDYIKSKEDINRFIYRYLKEKGSIKFNDSQDTNLFISNKKNLTIRQFKLVELIIDIPKKIIITSVRALDNNEEITIFGYYYEPYQLSTENLVQILNFINEYSK